MQLYQLVPALLAFCLLPSARGFLGGDDEETSNVGNKISGKSRPTAACASDRSVCSNFHKDSEKHINIQINEELKASYVYQSMSFYFDRDDVALRGFAKKFRKMSDEERDHAQGLMTYMNKRGGTILLSDIKKPTNDEWGCGLDAVRAALELEHKVNNKLLDLHWIAQEANDPHLQDFLEAEYLAEQVESIKELGDWVNILNRMKENPLGEHLFDQELFEEKR